MLRADQNIATASSEKALMTMIKESGFRLPDGDKKEQAVKIGCSLLSFTLFLFKSN